MSIETNSSPSKENGVFLETLDKLNTKIKKNVVNFLIRGSDNSLYLQEVNAEKEKDAFQVSEQIRYELETSPVNYEAVEYKTIKNNSISFQLIYNFILSLSTTDPTKIHFDIVRQALIEIDENLLNNTKIIDSLARELVNECAMLKISIEKIIPKEIIQQINHAKKEAQSEIFPTKSGRIPLEFKIIELNISSISKNIFEKDNMFVWDKLILERIQNTKAITNEEFKNAITSRQKILKDKTRGQLDFWFNTKINSKDKFFHISPALKLLVKYLYEEKFKKHIEFNKKNVPAITKNIADPIKKILSPGNKIIETTGQIQIYDQNSIIGNITIPTISKQISKIVLQGAHKLNTVLGHRLIRFFVQTAFQRKINGEDEPRILKFERGAVEIAEFLNLKKGKASTAINQLLNAMAYLEFKTPYLKGNLIQLTKHKSTITNRFDAAAVSVGLPLLPYQTFSEGRSLLIPLLSDPPLVNPNQSHAGQYLLQMELVEEFSNQSILIAKNDVVQIKQQDWEMLAQSSKISKAVLKKVQDRWTQDGNDAPKFLEKIEDNFFKLGPQHKKEWNFLKEQGKIRLKNSNRGKASAHNQKKKQKKKQK